METSLIVGPGGHPVPQSPVVPETPLIVVPESDLLVPAGYVPPAPPAPERVAVNLQDHPLVRAPIIFAGVPRPRTPVKERAKTTPGRNRKHKRSLAKQGI